MIGIIVVGHGTFAKGLESSINLITGKQDDYISLDFTEDISSNKLSANIQVAIEIFTNKDMGVLVFSDLLGATPFKCAAELSVNYKDVKVFAGTNLAMLLEATLMRHSLDNIEEFSQTLLITGAQQVGMFEFEESSDDDSLDSVEI